MPRARKVMRLCDVVSDNSSSEVLGIVRFSNADKGSDNSFCLFDTCKDCGCNGDCSCDVECRRDDRRYCVCDADRSDCRNDGCTCDNHYCEH